MRRHQRTERSGSVLTLVLFLLPVLILFVGFSIDYANIQRTRTELRRATDLAAKSAALVLAETDDQAAAEQAANDAAARNLVHGEPLTLADGAIVFGNSKRGQDGRWSFSPGESPINAVEVRGSRENDSPDGAVRNMFGAFYGRANNQPVFSAVAAFVNTDIVLVLDRSSSMKLATNSTDPLMSEGDPRRCDVPWADSRWVALEDAVSEFTTVMESTLSKEMVGVVTFASDAETCGNVSQKVTTDQDLDFDLTKTNAALAARSNSVWGGNTDIDAGIRTAHASLTDSGRENAVKIMIVLTDGQFTEADPSVAAQAAAADGVIIYTVTFSAGANQTDMINIADIGGGNHYHADNAPDLKGAFRELGGAIASLVQ